MNLHELKITLRRLQKEKLYTLINVGGLAVSMAAALLIILYLMFELSYDRYHPDHEQIYRVATDMTIDGERDKIAINTIPLGPAMVEQLPEITNYLRIFPSSYFFRNLIYRYEDKHFFEDGIFSVDSTVFDFFHFDFVHGRAEKALTEPFSMVITRSMAERYFGEENPVGQIILAEGAGPLKVTAVIEDPPLNSHFQFTGLMSMSTMYHLDKLMAGSFGMGATWQMLEHSHGSRMVWVYLKTASGFDPDEFMENRWYPFHDSHIGDQTFFDDNRLIFQPVADIHLTSKLPYEMTSETGAVTMMSTELIRVFFLIAVFLLLIASINYTNLAISRFNRRSKEVGLKKVLGVKKRQLIRQFFTESVIATLLALFLALLLAELAIPFVNRLLSVDLSLNVFQDPALLVILTGIAVFVGLISGAYPAFYFSSFSPAKVLGFRFQTGRKTLTLKKFLIVLQFTISIFMIIATLVVGNQLRYINNKELGFDREQVVIIELQDEYSRRHAEVLRNDLVQSPYIERAAVSNYFPSILTMFNAVGVEGPHGPRTLSTNMAQVSPDYLDFMEMGMAEGRFFDWDHPSDFQDAVVINQAAKRHFGWDEAIGKEVSSGYEWPDGTHAQNRRVIGVIKDFHYASLSKPIEPMTFYPMRNTGNYLNVKVREGEFSNGLDAVQKVWAGFRPNNPLEYRILDQVIAGLYESQRVLGIFFAAFAWLCIVIAFLGLYGLSAYSVEQRTREIGIRKVLGAKFKDVLFILGKEFIWLILIAVVVSCALAFHFMSRWLDGFAYHAPLTVLPFVMATIAALGVALLAVVFHAWKAARLELSHSLKYE